jgi:hypothetical protein
MAMAKTRLQRLVTRFVSRSWAASMEASSRAWMVRCRACGFEQSIWDLGGVRWKAAGTSHTWRRCPACGARGWHTVYRRDPAAPAAEE